MSCKHMNFSATFDPPTALVLIARLRAAEARKREVLAACDAWSKNDHVRLMAGEMRGQEMRSVRACLDGLIREVRGALAPAQEAETNG